MEIKRISPDEAKELLDSDDSYVYIDVRTGPEFESGHVPGAKNIPVVDRDPYGRMQPNHRFVEIVEANFGKDAKCIMGCQMGGRSMQAASQLLGAGFTSVVDMRGGMGGETNPMGQATYPGWAARGLPTTTDSDNADQYPNLLDKAGS